MFNKFSPFKTIEVQDQDGNYFSISEERLVSAAVQCAKQRIYRGEHLDSAQRAREYLRLLLSAKEHEEFWAIWLTCQHQVIRAQRLFRGTIDAAAVYPREVLKEALGNNAAAVIIAHNHPSGIAEPSQADRRITERLQRALEIVDIRILDHFVVGDSEVVSFAERGWL